MTGTRTTATGESIDFEGLTIRFDDRVLRPRPWTTAQSRWATSLLETLPSGTVLELCAGAGQIGLAAVARTRRCLVCVEADAVAAGFAVANAAANQLADRVEIREARMTEALEVGEKFVLVIADPPWVRRSHTTRFPQDPMSAIDGGSDGLAVARECVEVISAHLAAEGMALLQLGSAEQAAALGPAIESAGLRTLEVRCYDGGSVVRLERARVPHYPR